MKNITQGVRAIANFMAVAAKTAPKARGQDNLIVKIIEKKELKNLADKMIKAGKTTAHPQIFNRDAENVRRSDCLLVLATPRKTLELNCKFCGKSTCREAKQAEITCAYNSGDLGIAAGSAVSRAADFRVDNRIMYTVGYTVKEENLIDKNIVMALGIPLAARGKNIFFDRN